VCVKQYFKLAFKFESVKYHTLFKRQLNTSKIFNSVELEKKIIYLFLKF